MIVGLGPGPVELLTGEARNELERSAKVFFRMRGHPVYRWLEERGTQLIDFSPLYSIREWGQAQRYRFMADAVLKEAQRTGSAVYALPGNPYVFETTSGLIRKAAASAGLAVRVLPGLSFLELIYVELELDPGLGLQIFNSWQIDGCAYNSTIPMLIGQIDPGTEIVHGQLSLEAVQELLLSRYPQDHPVSLVWVESKPNYCTFSQTLALRELSALAPRRGEFASLFVPAAPP